MPVVSLSEQTFLFNITTFIKDQLTKLGIDAKLDVQESAASYESLNNHAFDLAPWSQGLAGDDPDAIFAETYTCAAERNYSGFCSKEVDALFEKQSQTLNLEERKKMVNEMDKAAPLNLTAMVIYFRRRFIGLSRRVRNCKIHPSVFNNQRLQDVWLAKS